MDVVPPRTLDGGPVSSTEVRASLQRGDVERAARFLGRPYGVCGEVVPGAKRGRTLGFPTANVKTERPLLVPGGVYACRAEVGGVEHPAVANIGTRPTFENQDFAVEVYLIDFSGDLYGRRLCLAFHRMLREERRFAGVDALKEQIARDVALARSCL